MWVITFLTNAKEIRFREYKEIDLEEILGNEFMIEITHLLPSQIDGYESIKFRPSYYDLIFSRHY